MNKAEKQEGCKGTVLGYVTPFPCLVFHKHMLDYDLLGSTACCLGKIYCLSISIPKVDQFR